MNAVSAYSPDLAQVPAQYDVHENAQEQGQEQGHLNECAVSVNSHLFSASVCTFPSRPVTPTPVPAM